MFGQVPVNKEGKAAGVCCRFPTCMSYIMDSSSNRLYTTFPNIFSLLSADPVDLSYIQKNHFSKKIHDFLIEKLL